MAILLVPCTLAVVSLPGCSKEEPKTTKGGKKTDKDSGGKEDEKLVELDVKEHGTLKGTVVYDGNPPEPPPIDMSKSPDKDKCIQGAPKEELVAQNWVVNPDNKGVQNVFIFLKAPEGKYFKLTDEEKKRANEVVKLDQPHCAFEPHVLLLYPKYYDGSKYVATGQKFVIANSAPFAHNTKFSSPANPERNPTIPPKDPGKDFAMEPDIQAVNFECGIHPWMRAFAWSLDHPYAAVTDKDGKFEIKNVPAGAEVFVVGWHESGGYFHGGKDGTKHTFKAGDNPPLELKVKSAK